MAVFHRVTDGKLGSKDGCEIEDEVSQEFLDRIPGGIFRYRAEEPCEIDFISRDVLELFACSTYEEFSAITGNTFPGMVHPDDRERVLSEIDEQISRSSTDAVTYRLNRPDGVETWVDDRGRYVVDADGHAWFYVTVLDAYEMVMREAILRQKAELDGLTDVFNREAGVRHMTEQLAGDICATGGTLFLVDLDNFKQVNDTFGHPMGDRVLVEVAQFLTHGVRKGDIVTRLGGDEFAVFAASLAPGAALERVMARLSGGLYANNQRPADLPERLTPTITIGAASTSRFPVTFEEMYEAADKALYEAKHAGKNRAALHILE